MSFRPAENHTSPTWSFTVSTTATTPLADINDWSISPNPIQSSIQLQVKAKRAFEAQASIIDIQGRVLYEEIINVHQGNQTIGLSNPVFPSGSYFVQLLSKDAMETKRIVF